MGSSETKEQKPIQQNQQSHNSQIIEEDLDYMNKSKSKVVNLPPIQITKQGRTARAFSQNNHIDLQYNTQRNQSNLALQQKNQININTNNDNEIIEINISPVHNLQNSIEYKQPALMKDQNSLNVTIEHEYSQDSQLNNHNFRNRSKSKQQFQQPKNFQPYSYNNQTFEQNKGFVQLTQNNKNNNIDQTKKINFPIEEDEVRLETLRSPKNNDNNNNNHPNQQRKFFRNKSNQKKDNFNVGDHFLNDDHNLVYSQLDDGDGDNNNRQNYDSKNQYLQKNNNKQKNKFFNPVSNNDQQLQENQLYE